MLRQRVRREQRLIARLRTAAYRLDAAHGERTWAIVSARQQGLAIRRIAAATGLSPTRVHQLLTTPATADIPAWLSRLREPGALADEAPEAVASGTDSALCGQLAEEVVALRWRVRRGQPTPGR